MYSTALLWQAKISSGVKMCLITSHIKLHGLTLYAIIVFTITYVPPSITLSSSDSTTKTREVF